jgi:site-specific DNA-methyltransferase (adenine-specific)
VIYHGDAREILPTLGSVDAIVTDPPYSSGGMYRSDRAASTTSKYQISHETTRSYGTFSGDNRDQRSFEKWVDSWASMCLPLVGEGGGIGVFIDWRNVACVIDAIQMAGWVYRGLTPWHKGSDLRPNKGWFRRNIEFVVWGSAGTLVTGPQAEGECWDGMFVARVLFSGIGLLDYGLTLAGIHHAWLCERDEWRRGILAKRWPGSTSP